jgi:predicted RNA-binding protein with PUA-like domain
VNYWLMKSEPGSFSIDDLRQAPGRRTCWDGVRNYQVRNFMRDEMRKGDQALFYHSSCATPGVAGIVEIVKQGYPDSTAFDPKDKHYDPKSDPTKPTWYMVDVKLVRKFARVIELGELREHAEGALKGFRLLSRGNRLSIVPVTAKQWRFILKLE